MAEERKEVEVINIKKIIAKIYSKRRLFYLPMTIVFIISCIYIFSLPRYYSTEAKLAPEMESSLGGGTLGTIASAFGFDFGDMQTSDAITPLLYPDLMEDNAFVASLFDINVQTKDKEVQTNFYDYLDKHQKKVWWSGFTSWLRKLLTFKSDDNAAGGGGGKFDPYSLSKRQNSIAEKIRANVVLSIDKKTGVITIVVKDQDPLICRSLTDSLIVRLQNFITDYRTHKAHQDLDYYTMLTDSAEAEYMKACQRYSHFTDANNNPVLESYRTRQSVLENDMQLKYNAYSAVVSQKELAKSKVQERTPAFTILKGAAIPILPAGPKRVRFVMMMLVLAFICESMWLVRDDLHFKL